MKEVGAALATNITYILNMIISDLAIRKSEDFKDIIIFYDKSIFDFKALCVYLKIGVPGMLMLCFEWWAFELLAIFTGLIGVNDLAAEVVIINMVSFIFMLPLGISYSASALTGTYLGEDNIKLAKRFAYLTIVFDAIITSIICILLVVYSVEISELFTKEEEVIKIIK